MPLKLKCKQNWNVTKTENVIKTEMSLKLKHNLNRHITNTEMAIKWKVAKSELSPKLKCH